MKYNKLQCWIVNVFDECFNNLIFVTFVSIICSIISPIVWIAQQFKNNDVTIVTSNIASYKTLSNDIIYQI